MDTSSLPEYRRSAVERMRTRCCTSGEAGLAAADDDDDDGDDPATPPAVAGKKEGKGDMG